jgi:glucokinase
MALPHDILWLMTAPVYIGVDLGGTSVRAAQFTDYSHHPERKTKQPTQAANGYAAVIDRLEQAIHEVAPDDLSQVAGIGIAVPGPLDPYKGIIISAPNLPGWENLPLRKMMEERLGRPVYLGNDANLAALGEWKFGAGLGHNDVLYLTISTGIGGGVISGGKMLVGAHGLAAELGHVLIAPDGPLCGCGQRGHLEALGSGTALGRSAQAKLLAGQAQHSKIREMVEGDLLKVTGVIVGEAAQTGDEFACAIIAEAGKFIGLGIANLLHTFNPSVVILGGGVSLLGNILFEPVRAAVRQFAMSEAYWRDCPIVPAQLGDDSGLIGAAVLVMEEAGVSAVVNR